MSSSSSDRDPQQLKRSEIIIATIGLIGVLITAFLSNWDKLFPKDNVVTASYSAGYKPTGDFETEYRYFMEVSGARKSMEIVQQQLVNGVKTALISQGADAETIDRRLEDAKRDIPTFDEMLGKFMPLYQKYFTLAEIQELNKFYSTDIMRGYVQKMPLLAVEMGQLGSKLFQDMIERQHQRILRERKEKAQNPTPGPSDSPAEPQDHRIEKTQQGEGQRKKR